MIITIFSGDIVMDVAVVFFFVLFCFLLFVAITFVISLFHKERRYNYVPDISVIVPCYNEKKNIGECIRRIINSNYPSENFELIVIDDGSTDRTVQIIRQLIKDHPEKNIKLIKQNHKGKAEGLNLGISKARHDIIVTIDADTFVEKGCIRELVAPMVRKEVGAVNGISLVHKPSNIIEKFQETEYYYNSLIRVCFGRLFDSGIWFFGAVACYRRALFKGKFFEKNVLTDDMDIALRITKKGYKVITSSKAVCYTRASPDLPSLFRQRMRWWFGVLIALIESKGLLKKNASPSILFLYVNQFWWSFYSIFSLPIFIYQIIYWLPNGALEIAGYLFRWFSLLGPFYVLYKIPEWGLSFLNIFGVLSGIISGVMIFSSFAMFGKKINLGDFFSIFFYFPYTIIVNLITFFSLLRYGFKKKKSFVD